jgi:hypothetical protein
MSWRACSPEAGAILAFLDVRVLNLCLKLVDPGF